MTLTVSNNKPISILYISNNNQLYNFIDTIDCLQTYFKKNK